MRKLCCCLTVSLLCLSLINCGQVGELYLPKDDSGAKVPDILDSDGLASSDNSITEASRTKPPNSNIDQDRSQ